jgi:hypothetical protein
VQLAANTSGSPRWDLLYAALQVDANGATIQRYRKDPATEQVTVVNVVRTRVQLVTVAPLQGTPAAAPQKPSLPADSNGTYYFPLAYVRVPAGFTATTTIAPADIDEVIPFVPLARVTGASTVVPANQQYLEGGTVLSSSAFAWTPAAGQRPGPYLPPTMAGAETLLIALDLTAANPALWSHRQNSVVDSRDWRYRVWDWRVHARTANTLPAFAWTRGPAVQASNIVPQLAYGGVGLGSRLALGIGQSFSADNSVIAPQAAVVLEADWLSLSELANNTSVSLYVDFADGGKLKFFGNGAPNVLAFIWLTASAPFPNA